METGSFLSGIDPLPLLSEMEIARSSRFLRREDQQNYFVRKYALRILLGKFLGQAPAEIRYFLQENKKPAADGLQFNASHSKNYVAIAISTHPIGIDIEYLNPDFDHTDILAQCFDDEETRFIKNGTDPRLNFYTLWTRKEAMLKATGEGLVKDLNKLSAISSCFERKNEIFEMISLKKKQLMISMATVSSQKKLKLWEYPGINP